MINEAELLALLADLESFRVERTVATRDTAKFSEAVCAFANDMHGARLPGFLLIGADDRTGSPSGLEVTDELLRTLAGLTSDGNILPPPAITVYRQRLSSGQGDILRLLKSSLPICRLSAIKGEHTSAAVRAKV